MIATMLAFGGALLLTIVIEGGLYLLLFGRKAEDLRLVIAVNLITNPALNLLLWLAAAFMTLNTVIITIVLELVVVVFEGWCYRRFARELHHPFLFSLAANACSLSLGWALQRVLR